MAFTFGLLHNFGFIGALSEIGLSKAANPLSLASFDLGAELGQLAFAAGALLVLRLLRLRSKWPRAAR